MTREASSSVAATILPGSAPRRVRVAAASIATAVPFAAIALFSALNNATAAWITGFLAPALSPLMLLLRGRPRRRDATLSIAPGRVREAGAFGLRLRARDVLGLSTCAYDGEYAVTVRMKRDPAPHTIIVRDEATLARVVQALGGAHDGTGALVWPTSRNGVESGLAWGSVGATTFCLGAVALAASLAWPFLAAFPRRIGKMQGAITLGDTGVVVNGFIKRAYTYGSIAGASYDHDVKSIRVRSKAGGFDWIPVGWLDAATADLIASQINAAAARAGGERTLRDEPLERVRALRREPNETARAWLTRLAGLAATLRNNDYRSISMSREDLWRITEDPSESFEDRAAAGRLLVGAMGPEARVRVAEALANARVAEDHVRIVLEDDLERAAEALDDARDEELKRRVATRA